jgi:hypothetical protein
MTRISRTAIFSLLFIVPLLLAGAALPAAAVQAPYTKIEIHKAICPSDSPNPYANCHDDRLAGVPFRVAGVWRTTNANGVAI